MVATVVITWWASTSLQKQCVNCTMTCDSMYFDGNGYVEFPSKNDKGNLLDPTTFHVYMAVKAGGIGNGSGSPGRNGSSGSNGSNMNICK